MKLKTTDKLKPQIIIIFITVFIYLLGFGIIIPIMPILATKFGASSLEVGLLMAVYSAMQFIFSPFWGRLSDRYGRRPILLFCLLGEVLSYCLFALSHNFTMLFLARALAGFFGASISTASAYISDITPEQDRTKGMAIIGAAFGLGFLFGPALGGILVQIGDGMTDKGDFGISFSAYFVALLCLINFSFAYKFLSESLLKKDRATKQKPHRVFEIFKHIKRPLIGSAIALFFFATLAMASMEATLILYMAQVFSWGLKEVSFGFAYIGLISVVSQGFIVRRFLPIWGEKRILLVGLSFMAASFVGIAIAPSIPVMAVVMTLLALGNSFVNPATLGSISLLSSKQEQGELLGTAQGAASLGRILGPIIGGFSYQALAIVAPFYFSAFFIMVGLFLLINKFSLWPENAKLAQKQTAEALPVGYFQIENLIKNRVPFLFINFSCPMENIFKKSELAFLQMHNVSSESELRPIVKNTDMAAPILILCANGELSKKCANQLSAQGFTNVFYVLDGFSGLELEKKDFV